MKFYTSFIVLLLIAANSVLADVSAINIDKIRRARSISDVAIGGFDVVHYFNLSEQGKAEDDALIGSSEFQSRYDGFVFYFSSKSNLEKFEQNPQKYVPQYGGYCAYAMANGYIAKINPNAWRIVEGKLYLQYSKRVRRRWDRDRDNYIRQANDNWPGILSQD